MTWVLKQTWEVVGGVSYRVCSVQCSECTKQRCEAPTARRCKLCTLYLLELRQVPHVQLRQHARVAVAIAIGRHADLAHQQHLHVQQRGQRRYVHLQVGRVEHHHLSGVASAAQREEKVEELPCVPPRLGLQKSPQHHGHDGLFGAVACQNRQEDEQQQQGRRHPQPSIVPPALLGADRGVTR
ncbi:hypothetical protein B484DRAFT_278098 [Ochromonadaceae sp. CCMP2298]|nr:hypothetical protein B484DRAFT_278098 [Ochromonadaceae sp. CCMP2298]